MNQQTRERMRAHIARLKQMPHLHLRVAAIIALAVIFILGLLKASGPPAPNPANQVALGSSDASTNEAPAQKKITGPSAFPHITIKNFGQMDAHFYRGAQPKPEDYQGLAALGIKTIIDLRDDPTDYEKPDAEAVGIKYVNIPMSDKQKPPAKQVEQFIQIAKDAASWPFYVHCVGGRHRTGLIGAVYRYNNYGWDFDTVYREMKNYDYYSRWGHSAIKDYVQEYYQAMKSAKAAAIAAAPVTAIATTPVAAPATEKVSQPVTAPPPPKPKE